ncbi:hypothetical protein [Variovorax sp. UC122_21]|uniref:hypothetical protein n=1 Tax=Variovorax sp. UC122_21 TaxID=3374554 RepID=UPI003757A521
MNESEIEVSRFTPTRPASGAATLSRGPVVSTPGFAEAHDEAVELLVGRVEVLRGFGLAGPHGVTVVQQQLDLRARLHRTRHLDRRFEAAARGLAQRVEVVRELDRRARRIAVPGEQREVAVHVGAGGARGAGHDQVVAVGALVDRADAASAQFEFDRCAEGGLRGRSSDQRGVVLHRHDQRLGARRAAGLRRPEAQPQRAVVRCAGHAFDREAVDPLGHDAGTRRDGEAEVVGAEAVAVGDVPGDELGFEGRELADIGESGGSARARDLHGEQVRAVRRIAAVLLVAVRASEVQRIADPHAGLEVEFLAELRTVGLVAPFLDRGAAGTRVHAQHVGLVVGHEHEAVGQRERGGGVRGNLRWCRRWA